MRISELDGQQRLHLVDSAQLYPQWLQAHHDVQRYKYGMRWVTRSEREYLMRVLDARGNMRSMGPRSPKTEDVYARFQQGRVDAKERYQSLSERLERQRRLNRAVRIDRLPGAAGKVIQSLNLRNLTKDLVIIGTHALFAYEAMAGVHYEQGVLATGDIDLLYDRRRPLTILGKKMPESGLTGLLKTADKSFEPVSNQGSFRVANKDGFMVDFVTAPTDMRTRKPVQVTSGDLVAAEIPNMQWLVNAPKREAVVIAQGGMPVMMSVPDPRAFALHKAWLSLQADREPVKRLRDKAQARILTKTVLEYLVQWEFDAKQLKYLEANMILEALDVIESGEDDGESLSLPQMKF